MDNASRLIDFALKFELPDASETARHRARLLVLDTLGVMLAASRYDIGAIIHRRTARSLGDATLVGADIRIGPAEAACANGALANALDFDEGSHVATFAVAASLAVAEHKRLSGRDFLAAFIVAFEIGTRLRAALVPTAGRGLWLAGHVGPFAAAMASARLLRLSADQTHMALSIATASAAGVRTHLGTMTKALHSGHAARAGVEAALLAQDNFTADTDGFDTWLRIVCTPKPPDEAALRFDGALVLDAPTKIKAMPVCTPISPALVALIALRVEHGFGAKEIATISADLRRDSLICDTADDIEAAAFCAPYLLALAATRGAITLDAMANALHDSDIRNLMTRVVDIPGSKDIGITLQDGRTFRHPLGSAPRLHDEMSVVAKFQSAAAHTWPSSRIGPVVARVLDIEALDDSRSLLEVSV